MTKTKTEPDYDPQLVPGPWLMKCPSCPETMWASEEDPDAAQSEMYRHLFSKHAGYDKQAASALLAKVKVIEHG